MAKIRVKLSDSQRQDLHDMYTCAGYKLLKKKILPARELQLLKLGVIMSKNMEDVNHRRGAIKEHQWVDSIVKESFDIIEKEEAKASGEK